MFQLLRILTGHRLYWANVRIWFQGHTFELGSSFWIKKVRVIKAAKLRGEDATYSKKYDLINSYKQEAYQVEERESGAKVYLTPYEFNLWIKNGYVDKQFKPREHTIRSMSIEDEALMEDYHDEPSTQSIVYEGVHFEEDLVELGRSISSHYAWPTENAVFDEAKYEGYQDWDKSRFRVDDASSNPDNVLLAEKVGINLFEEAYAVYGAMTLEYLAKNSPAFAEFMQGKIKDREQFFLDEEEEEC